MSTSDPSTPGRNSGPAADKIPGVTEVPVTTPRLKMDEAKKSRSRSTSRSPPPKKAKDDADTDEDLLMSPSGPSLPSTQEYPLGEGKGREKEK